MSKNAYISIIDIALIIQYNVFGIYTLQVPFGLHMCTNTLQWISVRNTTIGIFHAENIL